MNKALLLLWCLFFKDTYASYCYPSFCRNTTDLDFRKAAQEQCLIQRIQRGPECKDMTFESLGHAPPDGEPLAQAILKAYVKDFGGIKGSATAFNFSISNVNFNRLITRYQNIGDEEDAHCRRVEFNPNSANFPIDEFFISCPFSNRSYENNPYRLEYLIHTDEYEYSRKLVFNVPNSRLMDDNVENLAFYPPFIYVDVSDSSVLTLYIQTLPERFKVSGYKIWMVNNSTGNALATISLRASGNQFIQHNFTADNTVVYFKVAALHSSCRQSDGCFNSTSPFISLGHTSSRLIIMIISMIWIPPAILYVVCYVYKVRKKAEFLRRLERKPKCLLIYSPTHMAHVNVMIDLARYLRCCNINAMIDSLDIHETENKDPVLWCNAAFQAADIILVATSPKTDEIAPVVYRNMDSLGLRLLKENYPRFTKKYYAIQFPYCKADDIPKEARHFKRFSIPEDLLGLVKTMHEVEYIRFFGASDKDLMESIKLAKMQIVSKTEKRSYNTENPEVLLLPNLNEREREKKKTTDISELSDEETKNNDSLVNKNAPKQFKTNIEELNLLGEAEGESETISINAPPTTESEFRIVNLNL